MLISSGITLLLFIGPNPNPDSEILAQHISEIEVEYANIETDVRRTLYETATIRKLDETIFLTVENQTRHLRWITNGRQRRVETRRSAESLPYIRIVDGSGTYSWKETKEGGTITTDTQIHTGDSLSSVFNQAFKYWFAIGGPNGSLSEAILASTDLTILPTATGGIARFGHHSGQQPTQIEFDFAYEPRFHVTRLAWTANSSLNATLPAEPIMRREIVTGDWCWYDSLYLPARADSFLYTWRENSDQQSGEWLVGRTRYERLSAARFDPAAIADDLFEPKFPDNGWVFDERTNAGFLLGGNSVVMDGMAFHTAEPVHITDFREPFASLTNIGLVPDNSFHHEPPLKITLRSTASHALSIGLAMGLGAFCFLSFLSFCQRNRH